MQFSTRRELLRSSCQNIRGFKLKQMTVSQIFVFDFLELSFGPQRETHTQSTGLKLLINLVRRVFERADIRGSLYFPRPPCIHDLNGFSCFTGPRALDYFFSYGLHTQ